MNICRVIIVIWHLIKRHKQLPGLVYEVKASLYWVQDVTGRTVSQVKKFSMIQTSNIVLCFRKFSLVLSITLSPTAFFMLDTVGSHLHVAEGSICDQDHNVLKWFHYADNKTAWLSFCDCIKKKQSGTSDQAQFLQLDPGHKCFYKHEKWLALKLCKWAEFRMKILVVVPCSDINSV